MTDKLLLISGNDIPFNAARAIVHQPTLKEIAYIGEETFFTGCNFLNFSKDTMSTSDKVNLEQYNDFDILMTMIINSKKNPKLAKNVDSAMRVLELMFPLYNVSVRDNIIVLQYGQAEMSINNKNFTQFKQILSDIFCLKTGLASSQDEYNVQGEMAQRIADKLKARHRKLAELKAERNKGTETFSILSRYASILAVGEGKTIHSLMQYTVYQLFDEFQRYQLKVQWDAYVQAKMAGAQNLDEVDNWMIDLVDQGKNKNKK